MLGLFTTTGGIAARTSHRWTLLLQSSRLLGSVPSGGEPEEESSEWIRPNRPLVGDKGSSDHATNEKEGEVPTGVLDQPIDWLSTRRTKQSTLSMGLPNKSRRFDGAELEVLPGVLLSSKEIEQCLTTMGGFDYLLIPDDEQQRMGGANGIILISATSSQHVSLLSDTLVRQLKNRKLHDFGVEGATQGSKGSRNKKESWKVIDCNNYIVHIMLEDTRRHLNIEALWSGEDDLWYLDFMDEKAVDDYVARNPVPPEYGGAEYEEITDTISQLERLNDTKRNVKAKTRQNFFKEE